jgi:hypothetical protein
MKDNKVLYAQLSEDWRSRDRITWQLPAVLIVIGGILLVGVYGGSGVSGDVKIWLLSLGLLLAWLFTIMLTRNLYLQSVGHDLIKCMHEHRCLEEIQKCALRIPEHRQDYRFREALGGLIKTFSSSMLLLVCTFIAGLFMFLIRGSSKWWILQSGWWILAGIVFSCVTAVLTLSFSYYSQEAKTTMWEFWKWSSVILFLAAVVVLALFIYDAALDF